MYSSNYNIAPSVLPSVRLINDINWISDNISSSGNSSHTSLETLFEELDSRQQRPAISRLTNEISAGFDLFAVATAKYETQRSLRARKVPYSLKSDSNSEGLSMQGLTSDSSWDWAKQRLGRFFITLGTTLSRAG
jgi:hypothetical protein